VRRTCTTPGSPSTTWPTTWAPWSQALEKGGYSPEEATEAALQFVPDILRYDRTKPISYPNGRKLIDDVYSYRFSWLTRGKVPPIGLKPHDDLQVHFPYLGLPNH
jgi:hypothetical protein